MIPIGRLGITRRTPVMPSDPPGSTPGRAAHGSGTLLPTGSPPGSPAKGATARQCGIGITFDPPKPAGGPPAFCALGDSGTDSAVAFGYMTSKNACRAMSRQRRRLVARAP